MVDDDLGMSGAGVAGRSGFQSLVAAVGLGEVGLILGKKASRLARRGLFVPLQCRKRSPVHQAHLMITTAMTSRASDHVKPA